MKENKTTMYWI